MGGRARIAITDREIAGVILMTLARHRSSSFCLSYVYDYDTEFLCAVAKALNVPPGFPGASFIRRLQKVCRHIEKCDLLAGKVSSCHKEYIGEPTILKSYQFSNPGYACRLAPEKHPHYRPMGKVETELNFLLYYAYPDGEYD